MEEGPTDRVWSLQELVGPLASDCWHMTKLGRKHERETSKTADIFLILGIISILAAAIFTWTAKVWVRF
jgi:hypothetical protein